MSTKDDMQYEKDGNTYRIDGISQRIISTLYAVPNPTPVNEIRTNAEIESSQKVHYRCRNHLCPAGLVAEVGKEPINAGKNKVTTYRLTDEGESFFIDNKSDLDSLYTRSEQAEIMTGLREQVKYVTERLDEVDGRMDSIETDLNTAQTERSQHRSEMQEMREEFDNLAGKHHVENNELRIEQLQERNDELKEQNSALREDVETLKQHTHKLQSRLDHLEDEQHGMKKVVSSLKERMNQIAESAILQKLTGISRLDS